MVGKNWTCISILFLSLYYSGFCTIRGKKCSTFKHAVEILNKVFFPLIVNAVSKQVWNYFIISYIMLSCCSCHWCYFILIVATDRSLRNVIVTILKCILNVFHSLFLGRCTFLHDIFLDGNRMECYIKSVSFLVCYNTDIPPLSPKKVDHL